jgi:hypothetical protein
MGAEETALRAGRPTENLQQPQRLPAKTGAELALRLAGAPTGFSYITKAGWWFFLSNTAILVLSILLVLPWTAPQLPAPLEGAVGLFILGAVLYLVFGWGICKALGIGFITKEKRQRELSAPSKRKRNSLEDQFP